MKCLGFSSVQIENRLIIRGGFICTKGNYVMEEVSLNLYAVSS